MTGRTIRADVVALRRFGPDIRPSGEALDAALVDLAAARYRLVSSNSFGVGQLPDLDVDAMAMRLHTEALAEGFARTADRLEAAGAAGTGVGVGSGWRTGVRTMVTPRAVADAERFRSGRTADRGDAVGVDKEITDTFTLDVAVGVGVAVGVTVVRQVRSDGTARLVVLAENGVTGELSVGPPSITAGGRRGGGELSAEAKGGIGATVEQGRVYEFRDEAEMERFWHRQRATLLGTAAVEAAATNVPGGSVFSSLIGRIRQHLAGGATGDVSAWSVRAEAGVEAAAKAKLAVGAGGSAARGPIRAEAKASASIEGRRETTNLGGGVTEQRVTVKGELKAGIEADLPVGDLSFDPSTSTSPTVTATLVKGPDGPIELRLSTTTDEPPAWLGHEPPPGDGLSFRTDVVLDLSNRATAALVARHYGRPIEQLDTATLVALMSSPIIGELAERSEIVVSAQQTTDEPSQELGAEVGAIAKVAVTADVTSTTQKTVETYRKREGEQTFRRDGAG